MNTEIRKMTASDAVAVFLRAAEGMDPKIARAFIQAIETIRLRIPAEQIALLLERRDYTSLENAFSSQFTSTVPIPCLLLYLIALDSRLMSTCFIRSRSARTTNEVSSRGMDTLMPR